MDVFALLLSLAEKGTGWILAVVLAYGLYRNDKEWKSKFEELHERRAQDLKDLNEIQAKSDAAIMGSVSETIEKSTKVADSTYQIVANLQQLFNLRNKG